MDGYHLYSAACNNDTSTVIPDLAFLNQSCNDSQNISKIFRVGKVPTPPVYILVTTSVLMALIFILGMTGNIIVMIVVGCSRNMRSIVNTYLLNLCVADLLVLVICMPAALTELYTRDVWIYGEFMCKLVPFLEVVISSTSIFSIMAISIERFRVVCKPLSSAPYRLAPTIRTIIFTWFLSVLISVPMFTITVYKSTKMRDGTPIKVCRMPINTNWKRCYVIANYTFVYAIPVIVLFVLYSKVIKQLKASSANCLEFNDGYACNQERHRIRRQVINIILCVVFVFFLCHLPFRVISLVLIFGDIKQIRKITFENYLMLLNFSRCLLYANHALNPILYNFVSTKFRTAFKFLIFHGNRTGSDRRNKSPGAYFPTPNQRIVFKRKDQSTYGDNSLGSDKDKESGSGSDNQRRKERNTYQHNQRLNPDMEENSRLLVAEENIPCRWSEDCIKLDLKEKPSAKVRFIMTPEGCVIGITLHKISFEDKNIQTYST